MEMGIDSSAALQQDPDTGQSMAPVTRMQHLVEEIVVANKSNVDVVGLGEHHRANSLDTSSGVILASAAKLTRRIKLTSAVTY